jgi:flagellar hook-length control protein FliK
MTTQIINVPLMDKANTGKPEPVQSNSKKSAQKEGTELDHSSHSSEGGASGDLRHPTARFGETLKKKIAQDQGAVQMDGTLMSHKTVGQLLKGPIQDLVPENSEPGKGKSATAPLGQGKGKPLQDKKQVQAQSDILPSESINAEDLLADTGPPPQTQAKTGVAPGAKTEGIKAVELERSTPELMPVAFGADSPTLPVQKGTGLLKVESTSPVPVPAKPRPGKDLKVLPPATASGPQEAASQMLRFPQGKSPVQLAQPDSKPSEVQGIAGPVVAQSVSKTVEIESITGGVAAKEVSMPVDKQSITRGVAAKEVSMPVDKQSITGVATAQGVAQSSRVQDTDAMATAPSAEKTGVRQAADVQKRVNPSSPNTQAQEGEVKLQLQSIPANPEAPRVDQQTRAVLQGRSVAQSAELKDQGINARHSPRQAGAEVFQNAAQHSGLKTPKQGDAGVSGLAAEQRPETAAAPSSGQLSDARRFIKETPKPKSVKVQSGPPMDGVTASKAPTAMLPNEGQVNPVNHTLPGNSQVSILETDVSNPAEIKPSSLFDGTTVLKDTSSSVSGQILESIHSSLQQGQNRLTIALNPPELGRVLVRFEEQDNQLIGVLEVSQKQTRAEIEQALPQLLQSLQDSGVQVKRLDVMLNDQPGQGHAKDQTWNDSSGPNSEQQNQQERENRSGSNTGYNRQGSESKRSDAYEPEGSRLTGNNAVNMLA